MEPDVTLTEATDAIKELTDGWGTSDPRWDLLQTIAHYYQQLPTPQQLTEES